MNADQSWHLVGAQIFQNWFCVFFTLANALPELKSYNLPFNVSPIFKILTYKKKKKTSPKQKRGSAKQIQEPKRAIEAASHCLI